ncbi:hypothetical protein KXV22_003755 [Aspergillus fumigatus]|nr:hypothetical protein KXX47_004273 [Aspergillus fumigatus]KAH1327997.1 hypothetical protein KXX38_004224 [Aspergillus fumigatus]KAH1396644.1 hypothetical protein KXX49_007618 [Aspergillus fumigatus]KAH1427899.1 hypothetical protein KXX64_002143 [Aspergillus fumigatus]KAH1459890.1 hypothetical protein KXX58_008752 [Aspergillus fumigatus]
MRDMPSKFIEILDPSDNLRFSDSDVRLEDVLADHEAIVTRPRSATKISDRSDRDNSSSPVQRWKRLSTILITPRRPSTSTEFWDNSVILRRLDGYKRLPP